MKKNNYLIDQFGNPYVENESLPVGGGLDKRCDYNAEALHAYNELLGDTAIVDYLEGEGFEEIDTPSMDYAVFEKGNTRIVFESYIGGMYGYVHTEYIKKRK